MGGGTSSHILFIHTNGIVCQVLLSNYMYNWSSMEIKHHLIQRTPFGIQETIITDVGHIELWGDDASGYRWRFTGQYIFPTSDQKIYSNRPDAFEAAANAARGST